MKIKSLLPKTLFARLLMIILIPMFLVQVVTILIFYERHWDTVTRYMANNLAADIAVVVDHHAAHSSPAGQAAALAATADYAQRYFHFRTSWDDGGILPLKATKHTTQAGNDLARNLQKRLSYPFDIRLHDEPDNIAILVQFADGVLAIKANRKRIFSSTSLLVILWTISTSLLLSFVALLFVRGQVRPIHRLAEAARQLGFGRPAPNYKLEGSREVRQAGRAFKAMRQRIQRQLVERTEMLAGVSHDLRTPLTRMKLQLEFLPNGAEKDGFKKDISDMESMIAGYINFASHAVSEDLSDASLADIARASIDDFNRHAGNLGRLTLILPPDEIPVIPLRQRALRRALDNLIGNALRHATHCEVCITADSTQVQAIIDDDGAGIPKDQRANALRPFTRLTAPPASTSASSAGLGLSIAQDAVLSHGGHLLLGDSPLGGLRVRLQLPR